MYKNILVPISFDNDRDAAGAISVARTLGGDTAKVTLLHVMEQIPVYAISYMPQDYLVESRQAIQAELDDMAATLPNGSGLVVDGHSGRTILDWAKANGVDCIVMASHRPGMQDLLLGSTAAQVVRHATCAVHILR
ncbi:universal stress protein [Roseovarius sp. TE539]|uniref:universal stress protein n=1 Tax=Roseovarius sp. TE539 TaxID=2249812 RepID=UPI000DDD52CE|nr:universal stress protein [Roseovarius sp. TE539]RBI73479.1 universal stress protein [Roseovarius sp. TE539]